MTTNRVPDFDVPRSVLGDLKRHASRNAGEATAVALIAIAERLDERWFQQPSEPGSTLDLQPMTRRDYIEWAGTQKPEGAEAAWADITVEGLPPKKVRDGGRPMTVFFRPRGYAVVDATGISISFTDQNDAGWKFGIHKPCVDFALAVEVAKSLRPTMKFNVLLALGFEADQ